MRDKYFIDEQTMRRIIASLSRNQLSDVAYLQQLLAKEGKLQPGNVSLANKSEPSVKCPQ